MKAYITYRFGVKRALDSDKEKGYMGRMRAKYAIELVVVSALALLFIVPACRKENAPLDRNKAPETVLTSSPTETTATDYRVHMYWHSIDDDGVVNRYIWYISDTLETLDPVGNPDAEGLDWNPSARIVDYLKGRFTSKTDTVIIFKGYDDKNLAQINRQAFHIAAIDDGGKIDPTPARLQFFARVKGIPIVNFWTVIGGTEKAYNQSALDTISMFVPFSIRFLATTVNNVINGYRWSYSGNVYPDYNNDGNPDWLIPENQTDRITVSLPNTGADVLPSGVFNFKVIARDEAGALSKSDIISGVGVCRVVVNHDPDTEIKYGQCFYTPRSSGVPESLTVDFSDGVPDTLPYNSRLRMSYQGWDHPADRTNLQYNNPPLPIRFQFGYNRWAYDEYGARVADKVSSWYPLKVPEDTNPFADIEDSARDVDSTTMRVGTFDYRFFVRSFDEQSRPDGTPPEVRFVGNFPPKLDSVKVGFVDQTTLLFVPAVNDTIYIGWKCLPRRSCAGGKLAPYDIKVSGTLMTKYFKFVIVAGGHDDRRDPPSSGIKAWRYNVTDPELDLTYSKEGEWINDRPVNTLLQECVFSITVPYRADTAYLNTVQPDSLVANPPLFLGEQTIAVSGKDINNQETFQEGIRGISPKYDAEGNVIPANNWITNEYYLATYARSDSFRGRVYLKLIK